VVSIPFFGITYALTGIACAFWSFHNVDAKLLRSLGALIFSIAAVNAYIEEWRILKTIKFGNAVCLLTIGFLAAYTALSVRLMGELGISRRVAVLYSYLSVVYLFSIGLVVASPNLKELENPPLAFYIFLALACGLHVPAFAAGKSQASRVQELRILPHADRLEYFSSLRTPLFTLGLPLLFTLAIQASTRDDWRLFGANVFMTIAITSLFAVARLKADSPMQAMDVADKK
jgi:hypothetical protein